MDKLFSGFRISDKPDKSNKENIEKFIKGIRVEVVQLPERGNRVGQLVPRIRTLVDLAHADEAKENTKVAKFRAYEKLGVPFLLVILPDKDPALYSRVKYLGDVRYGIHSLCRGQR